MPLLILVLSALVWRYGVTGPWALASGLMRYGFVALALPWPWLARPLPPSRRRQTVCVVQIVALLVALAPFVARPVGLGDGGGRAGRARVVVRHRRRLAAPAPDG